MSQTELHTKRRKLAEPLTPSKKHKKEKEKKSKGKAEGKKKDKGKSKAHESEFKLVHASLVVSIAPVFAGDPRAGVEEMLDSMIMRYIPAFEGVVLAHSDLRFMDQMATVIADCPFSVCRVAFDATVWRPHIGMKLVGKVNLCSPDHIALLVHRTFNVSIPRHHIPEDSWEFEYGAAENDPEFGTTAEDDGDEEKPEEEGGRWVHSITREKLGGPDGFLEFTVIGCGSIFYPNLGSIFFTIANEMLSLRASLQPDPFSPDHIPQGTAAGRGVSEAPSESSTAVVRDAILAFEQDEEEEEDSDDEDAFARLGRMGDEDAIRVAREREREAKEVEAAMKEKAEEKKRKRAKAEGEGKVKEKKKKVKQ
ncbi:hypothetical protein FIBSPDRAFT_911258 [Athelia psychrophila]|uniref:RPA43 OB domain-containing protein n=1 Tax=Athelia psychrophila TaxID=1759441 RepID=A0A166IHK3_9AGAM|nr:hypothetical protein FIBSPDRAFT_911258 [Fibularhizoctonia sp. CBS 109695]